MATMRINGTDFHMSDRSYALTLEGARLAEAARLEERRCYCPGDCNCRYPWRPNYCGCRGHDRT